MYIWLGLNKNMEPKNKQSNGSLYAIWERKGLGIWHFKVKESNSQEEEKDKMLDVWIFAEP